ncbi:hypothetical protein BRC81_02940 [Halobacteriales archaeon QS_1_68_20]|nr:MAG: hypothetical protein BRC81_02940 [Halobacteriales archaeon QS_1_68_20]
MPTTIDDFEDGNLSEYGGDTNQWSANTTRSYSGSASANYSNTQSATNWYIVSSTSIYTVQSDHYHTAWLYENDGYDLPVGAIFGTQQEDSGPGGYLVDINTSSGTFALRRSSTSGGFTTLASTSVSLSASTWYKAEFVWPNSGDLEAYLYDSSGTQLASLGPVSDTTYSSGGVGLAARSVTDFSANAHVDVIEDQGTLTPAAPSNLSPSRDSSSPTDTINLSWTDNSNDEDEFRIYRKQGSSSSSLSDYTQIATVAADQTTYTDSGLADGTEYHYRVTAYNSWGESDPSNDAGTTTQVAAPSSVTATVHANDDIEVTWIDESGSEDSYHVQMSRDGSSWVDPASGATVSSNSTSIRVKPNSDNSYNSQVGIDSQFQFRVRAQASDAPNSDWVTTGTVRTDPLPPHDPHVTRPNASTFDIHYHVQTDIPHFVRVEYREDTGAGYGAWQHLQNVGSSAFGTDTTVIQSGDPTTTGSNVTLRFFIGGDYQSVTNWGQENARYQFRLQYGNNRDNNVSGRWVYADYGNEGNVYFEDGFETGDLTAWDATSLADADSGVTSGQSNSDLSLPGAAEGSYWLRLDAGDYVQANLGNLSTASNVIVRVFTAAGSMDTSSEHVGVSWYDGSAWADLDHLYWEYNRQGWVQLTVDIPSSRLSTDNRLRLEGFGGGGDHAAFDHVVVSDILHEFTSPAGATSASSDTTVEDEMTISWANNHTDFGSHSELRTRIAESGTTNWQQGQWTTNRPTSRTFSSLKDGEQYDATVAVAFRQSRNGAHETRFYGDQLTITDVTLLPAPTNLTVDTVGADSVDLSWVNNHDYGSVDVEYKPSNTTTWQTDASGLSRSTETHTIDGLRNGEQYDARVLATTEHTQTEDA